MKTVLMLFMTVASAIGVLAQSINHPWHVNDRGGGRSSSGAITLQSSIGQNVARPTTASSTNLECGYIPGLRWIGGAMTSQSIEDYQGWNLISIPLVLADFRKTVLYPSAQSKAFSYQAGYQTRDTLVNGVGYWLKFPSPGIVEFQGTSIPTESLTVNDNWNMIGCASYPVLARDIHAVPPTSIVSNIFGYSPSSGYVAAETLEAGRGYWIKVRNAGKLVLKSGTALSVPGSITRKSTSEARAEGKS